MIIYANPGAVPTIRKKRKAKTTTPAKKAQTKGGTIMAHRSAAQKAATKKLLAWNRSHRKGAVHRNPTTTKKKKYHAKKSTRRTHTVRTRNPSSFIPSGGVLGDLLSKEGLMMIGGAFVAPMVADYVQEKIMPSATGWVKIGVKALIIGAGAWGIDRFLKQRKPALAFAVTGAAVLAADAVRLYRGQLAGLSDGEADYLATRPELMKAYVDAGAGMGDNWKLGLADDYKMGLADAFAPAFG